MSDSRFIGRAGEELAAEYLQKRRYKIVDRNFKCRLGEIDIIARNRRFIVFVEVKLRKNALNGEAKEFVTYSKQQKIKAAAMTWLASNENELQPRFDVIEIYGNAAGDFRINHIENAFE